MLFRKMLCDMKLHKMQFISIFLMTFLGVFVYTGIGGEWIGIKNTVDNFYEQTNLADVWLIGKGFSEEDIKTVEALPEIKQAQRRLTIKSIGSFSNKPEIDLNFIEKNSISTPYLVSGEEFSPEKDGIWIDNSFAKAKNLNVGDSITVAFNDITLTKTIKGTVYSSENVFALSSSDLLPNYNNYGYAYLSYDAFPQNIGITYNQLLFTTENKNPDKLEDSIYNALGANYSVYLTQKNLESNVMIRNEIDQHKAIGSVFPVAFLAIALLTILTTMSRIINNQRTQIGTLKAVGFNNKKILFHYVSYGLWISLAGAFLGAIIGPLTLPQLFYPAMSACYILPEWKPLISPAFYLMALCCVIVSSFVTYLACKKVLRETPSQALRPKAPKNIKSTLLENLPFWKKLGFNIQWNFRNIVRSKIRSLMAIIGVISCTSLLICAFGISDSVKDINVWEFEEINRFETQINLDKFASDEQISNIINCVNGEGILEGAIEIKNKDIKKTATITVNDNVTLIKATDKNRNYIDLPSDGVSISYKLAKIIGAKKGDEISWHLYGDENWITSEIAEIYRTPTSQGITLSREFFENSGYPFKPTAILSAQKVSDNYSGVLSVWSANDFTTTWDDLTKAMNVMIYGLIIAASILAIVVLYNLGLLSFTEMERELATLKVIGFKSRKIRHLLLTQNLWLSIIGIAIGIPFGKLMIDFMISTMGEGFDMMTILSIRNIVISSLFTLSLSVCVNLMFSKKIQRVDMVSSLKGTE